MSHVDWFEGSRENAFDAPDARNQAELLKTIEEKNQQKISSLSYRINEKSWVQTNLQKMFMFWDPLESGERFVTFQCRFRPSECKNWPSVVYC